MWSNEAIKIYSLQNGSWFLIGTRQIYLNFILEGVMNSYGETFEKKWDNYMTDINVTGNDKRFSYLSENEESIYIYRSRLFCDEEGRRIDPRNDKETVKKMFFNYQQFMIRRKPNYKNSKYHSSMLPRNIKACLYKSVKRISDDPEYHKFMKIRDKAYISSFNQRRGTRIVEGNWKTQKKCRYQFGGDRKTIRKHFVEDIA